MSPEEIQQRSRAIFREEAAQLLQELEEGLLDLERAPQERETLDRIFRALHTLKGGGATCGYRGLSSFVHHLEDAYNLAREGRATVTAEWVNLTLQARDALAEGLQRDGESEEAHFRAREAVWKRLTQLAGHAEGKGCAAASPVLAQEPVRWQIVFVPKEELWTHGLEVGVFWEELRRLGEAQVEAEWVEELPEWAGFDPAICHLRWRIQISTTASEQELREVFLFAQDEAVLTFQREELADVAPVEQRGSQGASVRPTPPAESLRVSAEKVDRLVNLVGELVILRAQLQAVCVSLVEPPPALRSVEEGLSRLAEELRQVVLEVRMTPVGEAFGKFRRVVRDLAGALHKEVEWQLEGGETEMDKTLLDQLADPLMHLVRNSLDHGMEMPEERSQAGKPHSGVLRLRAEQRGDRVWIALRDDGRGLDVARIRRKAIERGLATETEVRSDAEWQQMIFLPGFSTASAVSEVSGRGVGMDVVRRRVEGLRGTLELWSQPGEGTEVRMSLPLTLAMVEGLRVEVAGASYILPLSAAKETLLLPEEEKQARTRGQVVEVRGQWVPYVRLRELFGLAERVGVAEQVVLLQTEQGQLGVVVDRVVGQHQTVLKSLGWMSSRVRLFSGATVLGDGKLALVVDVAGLGAGRVKAKHSQKVA